MPLRAQRPERCVSTDVTTLACGRFRRVRWWRHTTILRYPRRACQANHARFSLLVFDALPQFTPLLSLLSCACHAPAFARQSRLRTVLTLATPCDMLVRRSYRWAGATNGWLAQLAERVVHTDEVTGSSPVPPTTSSDQSYIAVANAGRQLPASFVSVRLVRIAYGRLRLFGCYTVLLGGLPHGR